MRNSTDFIEIPYSTILSILAEANELEIFDINLCGGEPFLHPDLLRIISKIKEYDFGLSIVTNATAIDAETAYYLSTLDAIKDIQVSFDGHNSAIHNSSRANFQSVFSGFMQLVDFSRNREESPSIGIVLNKYNYRYITETINFFSKYTSRFHIMNLMHCRELMCDSNEFDYVISKTVPSLERLSIENKLQISTLKYQSNCQKFQFQDSHIDCLAGYTTLVISSDCNVYPCDVAPIKLGRWHSYGDIRQIYNKSVKLWKRRPVPWCYDVNKNINL